MKQTRVRRSRAQRRLQILQAAYLKHSGYSHHDIVKLLRSQSFTVTRDLQAAEQRGILETKTTLKLTEEQRKEVLESLGGGFSEAASRELSAEMGRRIAVHVCNVEAVPGESPAWDTFCAQAASSVTGVFQGLPEGARVGVAWGTTMSGTCRRIKVEDRRKFLSFVPLRGDALIKALEDTPSAICTRLAELWNRGTTKFPPMSLRGIPPVLPSALTPDLRRYFEMLDDYRVVIGIGEPGLLDKLNVILTSVGSMHVTSEYTRNCLRIAGIKTAVEGHPIKGLYGDLAGIPLYDADLINDEDRRSIEQFESYSIGLTRSQLLKTARRGRVVIVACAHDAKELAVREACRQGLVTDLIIDAKLRDLLIPKLSAG